MANRWWILALFFGVRMTMAFQFQSVAALAPLIRQTFGLSLADIGFLIGLYLSPGIALALPSGAIGRRFGDKPMVLLGLALMAAGGLIMAFAESWPLQFAGRLIGGTGGVLLNVLMSKMVTDWFAGKEIATAMAIFVNSWPAGIALALLVLPVAGTSAGLGAAFLLTTALIAVGLVAFAVLYHPPPVLPVAALDATKPSGAVIAAVVLAGAIWGIYNAGLGMIFGFGATMLAERGWNPAAAGSVTSLVLWLTVLSVPLGGIIADRSQRPVAVLVSGCIATGVMLVVAARVPWVLPAFTVLGLVCGLSAGPIMSLPARVLAPQTRAVGMGIFFTIFYVSVVIAPWGAGVVANAAGSARVAFDLGAAMLALCCLGVWVFVRMTSVTNAPISPASAAQSFRPRAR